MIKLTSIGSLLAVLALGVLCLSLSHAQVPKIPEDGFLEGKFKVRCPLGHDDEVDQITRNHNCKQGGKEHKAVVKGSAILICPDSHMNPVGNITKDHKCWICEKECKR